MDFSNKSVQDMQLDCMLDVNAASGAIACSISIPLTAGRHKFHPSLSLVYASSARNSIFGLGWSLNGLSFISIDTRKGLPKYDGTDRFCLGGVHEIVPQVQRSSAGWEPRVDDTMDYTVYYYRSAQEDVFVRFEKWVRKSDRSIHWRTRSKANVLSIYGAATDSRVYNPDRNDQVFIWLLEAQYDNLGNCIEYHYKKEDDLGIEATASYEKNRLKRFREQGFAQRYLYRITYGNSQPLMPDTPEPAGNQWLFEVRFDYGEMEEHPYTNSEAQAGMVWKPRKDAFSVCTPGFEVRTYRLCRRVLMYHHFAELNTPTSLTGIFTCGYNEADTGTTLQKLSYTGVRRDLISGTYTEKKLPDIRFAYTTPAPGSSFTGITHETAENLPQGFNHAQTRMIDLFGEGLPGILTESAGAWYYKSNLGEGRFNRQEILLQKPAQGMGIHSLGDFDNDGNCNLFTLQGRMAGFYEFDSQLQQWSGFTPFLQIPQVGHTKFIDINGDGFADLIVEQDDKIICYPFKGKQGFDAPYEFSKPPRSDGGYAPMVGNNASLDYFLADMTGDGLPDQVRITNGSVIYYPNLGNGYFGTAVVMENAPLMDFENGFDAGRIRLYDLDGSGTNDIIYIGHGTLRYWYNAAGNKFVEGGTVNGLPYIDLLSSVSIMDFLGKGTPCLVWSSSLSKFEQQSLHYLELTSGIKPRLLVSVDNGMGKEFIIEYGHSAQHYLAAKKSGRPWISRIPGHFTVTDKKIIVDHIANSRFETSYRYRDGYYDGVEKSFVTFGIVEQYDSYFFENASDVHDNTYAQPTCSRIWHHNGMFQWNDHRADAFYARDVLQPMLTQVSLEDDALPGEAFRLAYRTLGGKPIRQEIYATDSSGIAEDDPFQVLQYAYRIRRLQPSGSGADACFFAYQSETLSQTYDRNAADPRITHTLALQLGNYGDLEMGASIAYARRSQMAGRLSEQSRDYITAGLHRYLSADSLDKYQAGIQIETRNFECNHVDHPFDSIVSYATLRTTLQGIVQSPLSFDQALPAAGPSVARLRSWNQTFFWNDDLAAVLPFGAMGRQVFVHHEEKACFTDATIANTYNGKITPATLANPDEGNYIARDGYWWQPTAVHHFGNAAAFFQLTKTERDGSGNSYTYDPYYLCAIGGSDALGNATYSTIDYNNVQSYRIIDINDNVTELLYDALGMTIATFDQGSMLDSAGNSQLYGTGLLEGYTVRNDADLARVLDNPGDYLQVAESFIYYDVDAWQRDKKPLSGIHLRRENLLHDGNGNVDNTLKVHLLVSYHDGFGRVLQSKEKVEDGPGGDPRWLGSGHIVYNNKSQPVRQFEPFFTATPGFENDAALETNGVSLQRYYDAIGRVYKIDYPNGSFAETRMTPWELQYFDQNDTVERSLYKTFREMQPDTEPEKIALNRSLAHKDTPLKEFLDPLGRNIASVWVNNDGTERKTAHVYDIDGNMLTITDARGLQAFTYLRDMAGRLLYEKSIDAGEKWNFPDSADLIIHQWDSREVHLRHRYDELDRIVSVHVDGALGLNQLTERYQYGEDAAILKAKERNLRGMRVMHYDQAGTEELLLATPGGNAIKTVKKLRDSYKAEVSWDNIAAVPLSPGFVSAYAYDAVERVVQQQLPDGLVRSYIYHQGGGVKKVIVSSTDGQPDIEILNDSTYDARGMRSTALLGNGVALSYTYNADTWRLTGLRAVQQSATPRVYQDIRYTHDPVGNVIYMVDMAQQPGAVNPRVMEGLSVSAHNEFEYDALYQLKTASGRVHQALLQSDRDSKGTRHISLNNAASIERYTRTYNYDLAGNIGSIRHAGTSQNWVTQKWTSAHSNRSLPLLDGNGQPIADPETRYDASGNCIYLPHLRSIEWNYRNNISKAVVVDRSAEGKANDEEYYIYDGTGMRVRKVSLRLYDVVNNMVEITEKIYLQGCELNKVTRNNNLTLSRYTSRISDGNNTLATIHAWTADTTATETDTVPGRKVHYQLQNHLGSAAMELDENGDVISYEEYFPFGQTSFIAGRNARDIVIKEYRYSGKELDDFTGLYYFGYRYYAAWIGGWLSADPIGPEDDINLYLYVHNNPVNHVDPNGLQSTTNIIPGTESDHLTQRSTFRQREAFAARHGYRMVEPNPQGQYWEGTDAIHGSWHLSPQGQLVNLRTDARWQDLRDSGMSELQADNMVELLQTLDQITIPDTGAQAGDGQTEGDGDSTDGNPSDTATGAGGETADSSGTGDSHDTSAGAVNDATGEGGSQVQTNAGGGGGNTGDGSTGSGSEGNGSGAGRQGTGTGGGGTVVTAGLGGQGVGVGQGTGPGTGNGISAAGSGQRTGEPWPQRGGQPGATGNTAGGQVGGTGHTTASQAGGTTSREGGTGSSANGGNTGSSTGGSENGGDTGSDTGTEGGAGNSGRTGGRPNGSPDGVNPNGMEGQGTGGSGTDRDRNGQGADPQGRTGGDGNGRGGFGGGGNPDREQEEPSWWQRGLLAMAGAVYAVANIFIEAGKQVYDMVGLAVQCFGIATGWYNYEHEVVSGIGLAAEQGMGTGDILKTMGRNIIETPRRAWEAAERGDWFEFGNQSMNLYMIGRSAYGVARSLPAMARGIASFTRSSVSSISNFFRGARSLSWSAFRTAHAEMGATGGRGFFSFSRGYAVRASPLQYGLWRAGIAARNLATSVPEYARALNPMRLFSSYGKGVIGREIARVRSYFRGETLLGREMNATVTNEFGQTVDIRADLGVMDQYGFIKVVEAKLGPFSRFTENQAIAWRGGSVHLILETFFGSKVHIP